MATYLYSGGSIFLKDTRQMNSKASKQTSKKKKKAHCNNLKFYGSVKNLEAYH